MSLPFGVAPAPLAEARHLRAATAPDNSFMPDRGICQE